MPCEMDKHDDNNIRFTLVKVYSFPYDLKLFNNTVDTMTGANVSISATQHISRNIGFNYLVVICGTLDF